MIIKEINVQGIPKEMIHNVLLKEIKRNQM